VSDTTRTTRTRRPRREYRDAKGNLIEYRDLEGKMREYRDLDREAAQMRAKRDSLVKGGVETVQGLSRRAGRAISEVGEKVSRQPFYGDIYRRLGRNLPAYAKGAAMVARKAGEVVGAGAERVAKEAKELRRRLERRLKVAQVRSGGKR